MRLRGGLKLAGWKVSVARVVVKDWIVKRGLRS